MCCTACARLAQNAGRKKSQKCRHLGTIPQLCRTISSQLRRVWTIGKKLVKQQYLLHMSTQYGELRPTSGWDRFVSLGHPANFNEFRVLAALLHGTLVVGVSQTLRRWIQGATYIRQGGHHVGHWPTFLVKRCSKSTAENLFNIFFAPSCFLFQDVTHQVLAASAGNRMATTQS